MLSIIVDRVKVEKYTWSIKTQHTVGVVPAHRRRVSQLDDHMIAEKDISYIFKKNSKKIKINSNQGMKGVEVLIRSS